MTESFILAVDVGTTRTAAATARLASDGSTVTAPFPLGRHTDSAPSAIFVSDGDMLFGDAAERRGLTHPDRLVREVKRRIGDDVPIIVGDQRFSPEQLYARMVAWVLTTVAEREGCQPEAVSVAIPVTWGRHRMEMLEAALERQGCGEAVLITEPEAAIRHYEAIRPLAPGSVVGVYDLGGGTFDAAVVRKAEADEPVVVLGAPMGLHAFGGTDFDDIVMRHALTAAGVSAGGLGTDAGTRIALARLRRECVDAKESLSFDSETVVPVLLGDERRTVRLIRSEFEAMIEDGIDRTIDVFSDALDAVGVAPDGLEAILLTGGSSRIPRIAQLLSEKFDRPIAIDADPKAIIALGAARAASAHLLARPVAATVAATGPQRVAPEAVQKPPYARGFPTPLTARKRFRFGPAIALTTGTLVLAAGLAAAAAMPPMASPDPAPGTSVTPAPAPSAAATPTPERTAEARPGPRPTAAASAGPHVPTRSTPLLTPAPPADGIYNAQPPLTQDPTPSP